MQEIKKPDWLKVPFSFNQNVLNISKSLRKNNLVTVCEQAHCPNINECWGGGTATFMVLGDTCTRGCRFCNIKTKRQGQSLDPHEPEKIASSISEWGLEYVVITSVNRDDLSDQGGNHIAEVIKRIRLYSPNILIEILSPDFQGELDCLVPIAEAKPDVFAHNVETIERLQTPVRDPRANYQQSLSVLKHMKKQGFYTKSSLMLGLGEEQQEVVQTMKDLRSIDVDFLTLGQYLRPSQKHLPVQEYITPEAFKEYQKIGIELGFAYVASGAFVRSSYKAGEFFIKNIIQGEK